MKFICSILEVGNIFYQGKRDVYWWPHKVFISNIPSKKIVFESQLKDKIRILLSLRKIAEKMEDPQKSGKSP